MVVYLNISLAREALRDQEMESSIEGPSVGRRRFPAMVRKRSGFIPANTPRFAAAGAFGHAGPREK
jgi:hypothetical protein